MVSSCQIWCGKQCDYQLYYPYTPLLVCPIESPAGISDCNSCESERPYSAVLKQTVRYMTVYNWCWHPPPFIQDSMLSCIYRAGHSKAEVKVIFPPNPLVLQHVHTSLLFIYRKEIKWKNFSSAKNCNMVWNKTNHRLFLL